MLLINNLRFTNSCFSAILMLSGRQKPHDKELKTSNKNKIKILKEET